ncbi:unnamed protein product [Sphagnum tenellum]
MPLDDDAMDAIEFAVAKYQPLELSSPRKTIMQSHPMDFVNIAAAEVYIVDMTFGLPVSANVMREDIRKALSAPETFVVVRYPNDAVEIESERKVAANDLEAERKKKGLKFAALLDAGKDFPEFEEPNAEDLYGDAYNASLLSYLNKVQQEREDAKVKAENAPFIWLDIPDRTDQEPVQDTSDFNKDVKGAPQIKPGRSINKRITDRSITGSVDDRVKVTKLYKDANGNRKAASVMMGDQK